MEKIIVLLNGYLLLAFSPLMAQLKFTDISSEAGIRHVYKVHEGLFKTGFWCVYLEEVNSFFHKFPVNPGNFLTG